MIYMHTDMYMHIQITFMYIKQLACIYSLSANWAHVSSSINISKWLLKVEIVLNLEIMKCNMEEWIKAQFWDSNAQNKKKGFPIFEPAVFGRSANQFLYL